MPKIEAPQEIQSKNKLFPHWNNTFDKFNIFELTDYDKVVYLDSDIYVAEILMSYLINLICQVLLKERVFQVINIGKN